MNEFIKRKIERQALEILKWSPSLTLLGPRQIGKTTLANQLRDKLGKPSVYIDLEDQEDLKKVLDNKIFFAENKDKCVIIDEIQRLPELFATLRGVIDQYRVPARFILLGSASPIILKKATESLTGRTIYLELPGIHFTEVSDFMRLTKHWFTGGYPTPLLAKEEKSKKTWYKSFIKNFIEVDLPQVGLSAPSLTMHRLITMMAHNSGMLWNASNFAKSLGINHKTVASYRDFLEKTYLIRVLPPFFSNAKKKIVKSPKV